MTKLLAKSLTSTSKLYAEMRVTGPVQFEPTPLATTRMM